MLQALKIIFAYDLKCLISTYCVFFLPRTFSKAKTKMYDVTFTKDIFKNITIKKRSEELNFIEHFKITTTAYVKNKLLNKIQNKST